MEVVCMTCGWSRFPVWLISGFKSYGEVGLGLESILKMCYLLDIPVFYDTMFNQSFIPMLYTNKDLLQMNYTYAIRCALNMKTVQRIYSGFKNIQIWNILHINCQLLLGEYMVVMQTKCANLTYMSRIIMLKGLFTESYTWLGSNYSPVSWRVPHVGHEMLKISGTPDFVPFG